MKYLKRFQTNAQYTEYIEGDAILPNVSSIVGSGVYYKPLSSIITFTINGTTYQAEEGMTWEEWCPSHYNNGGIQLFGEFMRTSLGSAIVFDDSFVNCKETIVSNRAYGVSFSGGEND